MIKEKLRIQIVEDEAILAIHLEKILLKNDYHVSSIVSSGIEAIRKVSELKPDIILMDIMISGELDGIETAKIIKKDYDIPVIFLTALSDDESYLNAKEVSKYGYLIKPFNESELKRVIENALKQHNREMRGVS